MFRKITLLSGLAILGVVINHASGWGYTALFAWTDRYLPVTVPNYDLFGSSGYYLSLIFLRISSFAVPAFLFTSGAFLAYALRGSKNGKLSWQMLKNRIGNLLIPYIIWSFIALIYIFMLGDRSSLTNVIQMFFTSGIVGPYYYVPLLVYLILLSPFLVPLAKNHPAILLIVTGAIQFGLSILHTRAAFGMQPSNMNWLLNLTPDWSVPRWIFFYCFGLVAGIFQDSWSNILPRFKWPLLFLTILSAGILIFESDTSFKILGWDGYNIVSRYSFNFYGLFFIAFFLSINSVPGFITKLLNKLAFKSMGIYLIHFLAMGLAAKFIYRYFPWLLTKQLLFQICLLTIGLGIPLAIMQVLTKSSLRKYFRFVFG